MPNRKKYLGEDNIDSFLMFLREQYSNEIKACDTNDMMQIIKMVGDKKLPEAYLKFMECAGRGYVMFKGSDYSISDMERFEGRSIGSIRRM